MYMQGYNDYDYNMAMEDIMYDEMDALDKYTTPSDLEMPANLINWNYGYDNCIWASTKQIMGYAALLMGSSVLYVVLRALVERLYPQRPQVPHLISMCCGLVVLFVHVSWDCLLVVTLILCAYGLLWLCHYHYHLEVKHSSIMVAIFLIGMQLACEGGLLRNMIAWPNVRGIQMVATMKVISFVNDVRLEQDNLRYYKSGKTKTMLNLYPYLGYIFCPTTCVLGPWIPYQWYEHRIRSHSAGQVFRCFRQALANVVVAVAFLNASNCLIPSLVDYLLTLNWICGWCLMYFDALMVRCSHYFVSYLSQATLVLGHQEEVSAVASTANTPSIRQSSATSINTALSPSFLFGLKVTQVLQIEFPRSLHVVVRNWNIPMHHWLKEYVFRRLQATYHRYFLSLMLTYILSALLHGFHIRVHIVLLSLAIFTYVENLLRSALARIYDICITASCNIKKCPFTLCMNRWRRQQQMNLQMRINYLFGDIGRVYLINGCFSLLTIFNLSYLGIMVSNDFNSAEGDYNDDESDNSWLLDITKHQGFFKWQYYKFVGHFIHLIMYGFYWFI